MRILALATLILTTLPGVASAQVYQGINDPALVAERHRLANERARLQADQRAAVAQNLQLNTRLTLQQLEAQRQSQAQAAQGYAPYPYRALRSPEQERAGREAATTRREAQAASTSQIDAWLDRAPQ